MIKDESNNLPPHLPPPEEIETTKLYEVLLREGWKSVKGNQWVNEAGERGYYLIAMQKEGEKTIVLQSPVSLFIVRLPES